MVYPVTPDDVAARWRPLDDQEQSVAAVLLADATELLDARRPSLAADVAAGRVSERLVVIVLADMVQRVLRNPDVQSSVNLGSDGSVGQSFATAVVNAARPRLEVTDMDLAALVRRPVAGVPVPGIYSVPYVPDVLP